ncbi:hypothetical protein Ddc_17454 [Ditylenchus destructor]|nr:hypothetical protein Ddc_17454 [Ditylenchus destructor]
MKTVIIFLVVIQLANAWWNHVVTPEDEKLNQEIKAELPEVLEVKAIAGHHNLNETLDDIVAILDQPLEQLLLLDHVNGIVLAPDQSRPKNTPNSLVPLLSGKVENAGDLPKTEARRLDEIMNSLAQRYAKKMKEVYTWWDKPIYVVPVGKLIGDNGHSVLIGVLGERKDGSLCGIAALLVRFGEL